VAVDTDAVGKVIPTNVGVAKMALIVACVVAVVASVVDEV
jgi:hypothetical protein